MSATPPSTERPPLQTSFRRSFTVPARQLSFHEKAGLDKTDANAEVLYSHPNARVIKFSPPTDSIKSTSKADIPADTDYPIDTVETLPWRSRTETLIATGLLKIEKVRGSTNFLKCQDVMHAILRNSQCWCVNGESKFVLRVRAFQYYRIELPFTSDEEKAKVAELKKVFPTILRFERTPCPFIRAFTVDLPDDAITPRRKGQWKRRDSSQPNTPDGETPTSSRQRLERSWSSRVPPTSYPKNGPGYSTDEERRGLGGSSRLERRGSHLDNVRNSSPASFGRSEDGTDSDHQGSEHDSELENTTDRSATSSPQKDLETMKQNDKIASPTTNTAAARDFFRRLTNTESKSAAQMETPGEAAVSHIGLEHTDPTADEDENDRQNKSTVNSLLSQDVSSSLVSSSVGKGMDTFHDEKETGVDARDDKTPATAVLETNLPHTQSEKIANASHATNHAKHDVDGTIRPGSDNDSSPPLKLDHEPVERQQTMVDVSISDKNPDMQDPAIQIPDSIGVTTAPTETGVSLSQSGLRGVTKAESPAEYPAELVVRSTSEVSHDPVLNHATATRSLLPASDLTTSTTFESELKSLAPSTMIPEEMVASMQQLSALEEKAPSDTELSIPDSELTTRNSPYRAPLHTSIDSEEPEDELENGLSPVSSIDSFHTIASMSHRLSVTGDSDPEDTPVAEQPVSFSMLLPRHTRDRSDVTVTASTESGPTPSETHRVMPQENDQTPTLLRSSASDASWPEPATPSAATKDYEGIRQRFKARQRSFSPLPPASTIFTGDRIRHDSGSGHMTKTILQKIVIKPIEVAILVVHILTRIASGATVNDLLSGDLFRRPENQRTISGFADQLNTGKASSDTEDDYGIPIRGRRESSERRMALIIDDETEDGFEDID